jgi:hypothetical protein
MKFRLVPFTNTVILVSMMVLTLTGVYGLFWTLGDWVFDLHRISGWLLIASIPWKTAISVRSLRRGFRPGFDRGALIFLSLLLAATSALVIGLGLAWSWRLGPEQLWFRQTAISWHWMLALGLLLPFAVHVWRRWPRPKKADLLSRRAWLKSAGLGGAALAGWWLAEGLASWRGLFQAPRRYTGSREAGSFSGNRFPVTHSLAAGEIDLQTYRLVVDGTVGEPLALTYAELISFPISELAATLDCTLGWYTIQNWRGIRLVDLLDRASASTRAFAVRLESVTGYAQILPLAEARQILLATHVGEEVLDPVHGFPIRAVVPTRRGWFWVKWISRIELIGVLSSNG